MSNTVPEPEGSPALVPVAPVSIPVSEVPLDPGVTPPVIDISDGNTFDAGVSFPPSTSPFEKAGPTGRPVLD